MANPLNKEKIKLAVQGSRSLCDARVKILLLEEIKKYDVGEIITSGEPGGVCNVARKLCEEMAIPLKLYFLNFRYLNGAFEHRSINIINDADRIIFIHDGISKGTKNEIKLAQKAKVLYTYHKLEKATNQEDCNELEKSMDLDLTNYEI